MDCENIKKKSKVSRKKKVRLERGNRRGRKESIAGGKSYTTETGDILPGRDMIDDDNTSKRYGRDDTSKRYGRDDYTSRRYGRYDTMRGKKFETMIL